MSSLRPFNKVLICLSIVLTGFASASSQRHEVTRENVLIEARNQFISNLIQIYLTEEAKQNAKLGIEIEVNGLSPLRIAELFTQRFGGSIEIRSRRQEELGIEQSRMGEVLVYRDGQSYQYNDWINESNAGHDHDIRRVISEVRNSLIDTVEVVFPPLNYEQTLEIAPFLQDLKDAGATGPVGFRTGAIQVNQEIDPRNFRHIANILANHTRNASLFERAFNRSSARRAHENLRVPDGEFAQQLMSYGYVPSSFAELWSDFVRGRNHVKFAAMSIGPALLISDDPGFLSERQAMVRDGWSARPTVENRHADTVLDPAYFEVLIDATVALVEASKTTNMLNPLDLFILVEGGLIPSEYWYLEYQELIGQNFSEYSDQQLRQIAYRLRQTEAVRLGRHPVDVPPTQFYLESIIRREAQAAAELALSEGRGRSPFVGQSFEELRNFVRAVASTDPAVRLNIRRMYTQEYRRAYDRLQNDPNSSPRGEICGGNFRAS